LNPTLPNIPLQTLAAEFAAQCHAGQTRKTTGPDGAPLPYFSHLEKVAQWLARHPTSPAQIAAGYLHDTLEDTPTTEADLLAVFPEPVVAMVRDCTEDKTLKWEDRKALQMDAFLLAKLHTTDSLPVFFADKFDNLEDSWVAVQHQPLQARKAYFDAFNRGFDQQLWYYTRVLEVLEKHLRHTPAYQPALATFRQRHWEVFLAP
jgi:(p)ppGpp synthase/HD superfamily hydrolase